jgi:hypothetical protein
VISINNEGFTKVTDLLSISEDQVDKMVKHIGNWKERVVAVTLIYTVLYAVFHVDTSYVSFVPIICVAKNLSLRHRLVPQSIASSAEESVDPKCITCKQGVLN